MKYTGGTIILILLALALICGMLLTLWLGASRSRHGYGEHPAAPAYIQRLATLNH